MPSPEHRSVDAKKEILGLVADELRRVEATIAAALATDSKPVSRLLDHVSQFGGKRLRPALVALIGRACGQLRDEHIAVGTVVELIHLASLVHDDVLDGAGTRRNVATVHSLHGSHAAILLGDIIYARAFTLAAQIPDGGALRRLAETSAHLCIGEIEQNTARGRLDLAREEYLHIVEGKTASLYAAACELAARYAGGDEALEQRMEEFGRRLGVAFQVVDDCLDLVGEEQRVGKSLGTDLDGCKLTLPLLHLRDRLRGADRDEFARILTAPDVVDRRRVLRDRFDLDPDLAHARQFAASEISRALDCLQALPPSPEREALRKVGSLVLDRDH